MKKCIIFSLLTLLTCTINTMAAEPSTIMDPSTLSRKELLMIKSLLGVKETLNHNSRLTHNDVVLIKKLNLKVGQSFEGMIRQVVDELKHALKFGEEYKSSGNLNLYTCIQLNYENPLIFNRNVPYCSKVFNHPLVKESYMKCRQEAGISLYSDFPHMQDSKNKFLKQLNELGLPLYTHPVATWKHDEEAINFLYQVDNELKEEARQLVDQKVEETIEFTLDILDLGSYLLAVDICLADSQQQCTFENSPFLKRILGDPQVKQKCALTMEKLANDLSSLE